MDNILLTFDIDWAPDFIIDAVAARLKEKNIRATWFITHKSKAVDRLCKEERLFEVGLHPNFLPGSTQGVSPEEILKNLKSIAPKSISIRTHGLVQSQALIELFIEKGLKLDLSVFLPGRVNISPFEFETEYGTLLRIPYFWSDDYEMGRAEPCWQLRPFLSLAGLKVFNFHPVHIYLNTSDKNSYKRLKQEISGLHNLNPQIINRYIQHGEGPKTMFDELTDYLESCVNTYRARDIYGEYISQTY